MKAEWTNRDSLSIEETTGKNSKSILVIDTPENCGKCQLVYYCKCRVFNPHIHLSSYSRAKECPLRPLPEKLYVEANQIEDLMPSEFDMDKLILKIQLDADKLCALGWNACLDEILGETE